ncbi:MAG: tRNA pseudouridine(54/55) synthase Pus10 [Promethearchaeia archaeon]
MKIFEKVLEIYQKYYICPHCLGRMFSLLGSAATNLERGNSLLLSIVLDSHAEYLNKRADYSENAINILKLLAENGNFLPAQKVLDNEGISYEKTENPKICFLCENIFSDLEYYIEKALNEVDDIEFQNFLVGTTVDPAIVNKEDTFKSEFNIVSAEAFKSHFNREIGKRLLKRLKKPVEFASPEIVILFKLSYESVDIEIIIKPLYIYGRYNKYLRGIPQTHWLCGYCRGRGCDICNFTGKRYEISVEELISEEFIKESKATGSKFHGAGREDIDVRMLGDGRPFILELKNPKIRNLDLEKIANRVNQINENKIRIFDLRFSSKKEVIELKAQAEEVRKIYNALVVSEESLPKEVFEEKLKQLQATLINNVIHQRTPKRVAHRRADKVRIKKIYNIEGKYISPTKYEFIIETQGGTYIKELINGDDGRTEPSFSDIFGIPIECKQLDVIKIIH